MDPKSFTIKALEKTKNFLSDSANNTLEVAVIVKKAPLSILGKGYLYVYGKGKSDDTTDSDVGIQAAKGIQLENTHVIVKESLSHARNAKAGFTIKNAKPCFFLGIEWNSRKKEWKISNDFVLIVFLRNQFNFPFFYIGKHYNGPCENPV